MRLKFSNAPLITKTAVALVLAASVSALAVGCASQPGSAAPKVPTTTRATLESSSSITAASGTTNAIVAAAASQKGIPYCEGGGGINGPSVGSAGSTCAKSTKGYDCMSLAQYAVYQGTGHKVVLPNNAARPTGGTYIAPSDTASADQASLVPGDAVFFGGS